MKISRLKTTLIENAEFDAYSLLKMIEDPACTYSPDSFSHISQNTAFEILFKGIHPLDVVAMFPDKIREALAEHDIREKTTLKNIFLGGRSFSDIQILPFYRDYIIKFTIRPPFSADYRQIFKVIFDSSPLGILLIDKNMRFIAANATVSRMTGYSIEELKSMTFANITHPEDRESNIPLTRKFYFEEIDTVSIQKRFMRKDGSAFWINLVTGLTKDVNGEFLGGVGIVEDITEKLEVERQKSELLHSLEAKNKELVDSLAYARMIQNTILPRSDQFRKFFPKHFIYYHPRDIVGGDFYWIRSSGSKIFFAVADCTGHGVPGAFITLVGNYRLNNIYDKYRERGPAVMLEKLNNIIAYSFRNSRYSLSSHGMDIAMCSLDLVTRELEYAGANNSMYLIREGLKSDLSESLTDSNLYRFTEDNLLEVRADKHSIGNYTGSSRFHAHKFKLKTGDRVYLFSDGYVDQFGGEKAKKLKSQGLKSFLLSQLHIDFRKQKEKLHEYRKSWQGDLHQVDDICVIGLEL